MYLIIPVFNVKIMKPMRINYSLTNVFKALASIIFFFILNQLFKLGIGLIFSICSFVLSKLWYNHKTPIFFLKKNLN